MPLNPRKSQIKNLDRLFSRAVKDMLAFIDSAEATNFQKRVVVARLKDIQARTIMLNKDFREYSADFSPVHYADGVSDVKKKVEPLTKFREFTRLNQRNIAAMATVLGTDLLKVSDTMNKDFRGMLRRMSIANNRAKVLGDVFREQVRAQTIGTDVKTTRKILTQRFQERGIADQSIRSKYGQGKIRLSTGMFIDTSAYSDLIVRTHAGAIHSMAVESSMIQNGLTIVEISNTGTQDEICLAYEGRVFSLTEHPKFPTLPERPPWHPRCGHEMIPSNEVLGAVAVEKRERGIKGPIPRKRFRGLVATAEKNASIQPIPGPFKRPKVA